MLPERYIHRSKIVGTDELINLMWKTPHGELIKQKTEIILDESWLSMLELMQNGGAINLNGVFLSTSIEDLRLPQNEAEQLKRDLLIGMKRADFCKLTSINPQIEDIGVNKEVWLVAQGFEKNLGYRVISNGNPQTLLYLPDGSISSPLYLRWLRYAFSKNIKNHYKQALLPKIVYPESAVAQFLIEVADTYGRGRVY